MVVARKPPEEVQPVTPEWQRKVRRELDRQPRGAYSRLADALGVSTGQISELLAEREDKEVRYSRLVARVDRFFGWSQDTQEIRYLLDGLDEEGKTILRALKSMEPEQRKAAAAFLLSMSKTGANDKT